ncbi:MAG: hypothetical protein HY901_29005, partial [Deltaproteobacteria bacterium]|nr:hypothetical protein [Deltaproteobacteria bacterium]
MLLARHALVLALALLPASALAQRETTREALTRLEETMAMRQEDGPFNKELLPVIVVSVEPAFEESRTWYPTAALETLVRLYGAASLRSCEACRAPRLHVAEGRLEQSTADLSVAEIVRLDESTRGTSAPARAALWLDENPDGVSLRIVDLRNGRIVLAQNFDPAMSEPARTRGRFTLSRELERRARGDSLTHTFVDIVVYPGQHISLDWVDQWGDSNANLSGFSLSLFDPVLGVGGAYYRVFPSVWNLTVGAQVLLSLPTAIVRGLTSGDTEL